MSKKLPLIVLCLLGLLHPSIAVADGPPGGGGGQTLTGAPLWIYDSDFNINHVETAHLNGDTILDVIGAEYSNNHFAEPSKIYGIDGSSGATLWTYSLLDGVRSMTIGDLNNDGVVDVIAGAASGTDPDGMVHAINGATGLVLWTYPVGATNQDVAIGNLNGDAFADVAVGSFDDFVHAIDGQTGALLWSREIGSLWVNAVACGDVNGDTIDDVAYAHEYLAGFDNFFGVLDGTDGTTIWDMTVPDIALTVVLEDIDEDGLVEAIFGMVTGADQGTVDVRNGATGALEWQYSLGSLDHTNGDIFLHPQDLDQNGDLDLVVGNFIGNYEVVAFDGSSNTPMWMSDPLDGYVRDLAFADVTGDGTLNVLAATFDRVQVIDGADGSKTWYYGVAGTVSSIAAGDFNNDGISDLVAGGEAELSGFPPNPAKSIWALKTSDSPILWELDFGEYGNALGLADLNGDPAMDLIAVSSLSDEAVAIDGASGTEIWRWTGTENLYTVATGDITGNGQVDVVVAGNDDQITALDGGSGAVHWQFSTPTDQIYRKCIQVADLNNDGSGDVIAGSDDNIVYAIDGPTGIELWSTNLGGDIEEVELAQMNSSGPLDLVLGVGFPANKMVILDGVDGSLLWEYIASGSVRHVEVLNANGDTTSDVALATANEILIVNGLTQTSLWSSSFDANVDYGLSHGDLNGNGRDELVAAGDSGDRSVHSLDGLTGSSQWSYLTGGDINVVQVADVNGDGNPDVVAGSDDQSLYVLGGTTGNVLFNFSTVGDVMHLQIGDINGNGSPNIACVTFDSDGVVYAFRDLSSNVFVDNEDPGFVVYTGDFNSATFSQAFCDTLLYRRSGTGSNRAAFRLDRVNGQPFITPGTYDVYHWKVGHPSQQQMATDAPFRVFHKNGSSAWIRLDQTIPGSEWQLIGTFEFDNDSPQGVLASDDANGFVIIDALRLVPQ